jgi:hypothetical protein
VSCQQDFDELQRTAGDGIAARRVNRHVGACRGFKADMQAADGASGADWDV